MEALKIALCMGGGGRIIYGGANSYFIFFASNLFNMMIRIYYVDLGGDIIVTEWRKGVKFDRIQSLVISDIMYMETLKMALCMGRGGQ